MYVNAGICTKNKYRYIYICIYMCMCVCLLKVEGISGVLLVAFTATIRLNGSRLAAIDIEQRPLRTRGTIPGDTWVGLEKGFRSYSSSQGVLGSSL